ncbi:uncharacterized protein LOC125664458 [Ostrea edulis]|uniref:uncharacterized protein LOC125664458 n=1 Tax=Ostrea edulis TaxID=37623 RepID=UPI0024AFFCE3|nr:uncharacterized protein LOC125664458 [Ostrea edulis]
MQYNACYVKKKIAVSTPIVPVTVRPTGSGTSDIQKTVETAPTESQFNGSAMGVTLGVIVPLILLVVVPGILLFRKRRHSQAGTSNRETTMQNGECKALINKGTKCLEKNEHNELQIQKDTIKRESTMENSESKALESTKTKYLEENEQNQ